MLQLNTIAIQDKLTPQISDGILVVQLFAILTLLLDRKLLLEMPTYFWLETFRAITFKLVQQLFMIPRNVIVEPWKNLKDHISLVGH